MSDLLLPVLAGLALGSLHAFDADHITAISVFVSQDPRPGRAAMFGVRWAAGHTVALFLFGVAVMSLKVAITPFIQRAAEIGIGLILIILGGWAIHRLVQRERFHIHRHSHDGVEHTHPHSHADRHDHRHEHSIFLIGAAHGFAGTASVLVIIPITIIGSFLTVSLYIILFGIGTTIAMAAFAYLLGNIAGAMKKRRMLIWLQGIAGMTSIAVGCFWVLARAL